jgi:2-C-methyl-D-erythritol 4-phosphate cytidylyltransferase/2-C-methyl-D-erythritol 2,4-cyclodiphosphate synthase
VNDSCVIIPAAGSGTRFGGDRPKQFLDLAGRPVLAWTLAAFAGQVAAAVIAVNDAWRPEVEAIAAGAPFPVRIVRGGATRQDSVAAALAATEPDWQRILVHDAVRPLVPAACIAACLAALQTHPAAVVAVPCAATVKRGGPDRTVVATVPRQDLWLAQTPQGFRREQGLAAFAAATGQACTDDAQVLELAGHAVVLVDGDARNLKITTPDDFAVAAALLGAVAARG